jgi:DNA-binding MarR family transcriptional regulator
MAAVLTRMRPQAKLVAMETNSHDENHFDRAGRSLGKQINYIARSIRWIVEHELAQLGVGSGTHSFLRTIHSNPGITQNELSEQTQVDKATAAKGLAKLEALEYLTRVPDTKDRRIRRLYLTDAGERVIPTVHATLRHVTEICAANLYAREIDELFTLLDRVEEAVSKYIADVKREHTQA